MADFDPDAFVAKSEAFDPDAFLARAGGVAPASPYHSPDDHPTTWTQALAGHAADNIPFAKQMGALLTAAKMKAAGSPMGFGENYNQLLLAAQRQLDRSKAEHPWPSRVGSAAGLVGSAAALPGSGVPALAGLGGLFGLSDATANPENSLGSIAGQTAASAVLAPVMGRVAEYAAPRLGDLLGRGAQTLGDKAADLAGWLKVHSVHPTPALAERMASMPGGEIGVGKELLEQGVGGLTKKGTAKQAQAAVQEASGVMGGLARQYDASGAHGLDLTDALQKGMEKARQLYDEPTTRAAGERLAGVLQEYGDTYGGRAVPATEALDLKRVAGKAAYGAGKEWELTRNAATGDYSKGMATFERAVDDALDKHLGPDFGEANLTFRQLLAGGQAAKRAAARTQGNAHLLGGLVPTLVGGGVMASGHGGPEALAFGAGSALLQKYGSQAGARVLYSPVSGGLNLIGRGVQAVPGSFAGRAAAEEASPLTATLADLLGRHSRQDGSP